MKMNLSLGAMTLACVVPLCSMGMAQDTAGIKVDLGNVLGDIKPLHGVNNSPVQYGDEITSFKEAGIPFSRLHDTAGAFGGTHFVDIPNVFPNFDADPAEPASYDFAFTDAYLKSLVSSGTEPFYRLGVTIENHYKIKAYRIHPPADYAKWARICEGIVRHYTQGWADGFKYQIRYWEIWNEPENPPMWTGTKEEYFELYRVAANHLKSCFPELKVGGYGSCGFYAVTRPGAGDFEKSFITWFDDFLGFVSSEKTKAPLDFFSWHLYTDDVTEIVRHAEYVRERLNSFGFAETESIFDEWNRMNGSKDVFDEMREMPGAVFVGAALSLMQNSSIDKAMYYDALPTRTYGGLYRFPSGNGSKPYYAFKMFNVLYRLKNAIQASSGIDNVTVSAACGGAAAAVFITNRSEQDVAVPLALAGVPQGCSSATFYLLDGKHDMEKTRSESVTPGDVTLQLELPGKSLMLVELK